MCIPESNHLLGQGWLFSAVLLTRRLQMTLVRCHFAHRANLHVIANRWFDVGPTPVAQQGRHMPT